MNNKQKWLIVLAFFVLGIIIGVIIFTGYKKDSKTKIGLIVTGEISDNGWNGAHYKGVESACEQFEVELIVEENIPEEKDACKKAVERLVKKGVGMIILSSYEYPVLLEDCIREHKDISFYGISSEIQTENMTSYFGRMYQARYLAGVLAGLKSTTGNIGYVAAMSNCEVNRGINAFTLGVKSVNPDAIVHVSWTGSWDDENKEIEATNDLINNKGIDVITCHQNQPNVVKAADAAGIYSIGYNETTSGLSNKYLTATVWDWEKLYVQIVKEYMENKANSVARHWFGIETGVVKLSEYSREITIHEKQVLKENEEALKNGKNIFSGIIYDSTGQLRCNEAESISDENLLKKMDWYVDGVMIYEK